MTDVLVVGAGPAGLSGALELQAQGFSVTVTDDQTAPGGRIFAAIERRVAHGAEERVGAALVAAFRASGGTYLSGAEVWQIESGQRVFLTQAGQAKMIEPRFVLLATGAQERPMPFPGWQLPGVMTVGAAQTTLKTAALIPDSPVWVAGTGPLLLLYVHQLLAAGGRIAGILDTAPPGQMCRAARLLPGAIGYGWRDFLRGLGWLAELRGIRRVKHVVAIEAVGADRLETIRFETGDGSSGEVSAELLLVHDGVVPSVHATMAADCAHRWNNAQRCFEPVLDRFGASTSPGIYVAGDGAGIAGAHAATLSGRLAAIGIACAAGQISMADVERLVAPLRKGLAAAARFRQFLDVLYPPVDLAIPDDTLICRCEEVTALQIRKTLVGRPQLNPDGVKIATRAGMGPCQGRLCGLSLMRLIGEAHNTTPEAIGFLTVRPPLKPLTLGELATLEAA
jgi:NADPH-dependent 2,4-dienoyl-CoA reductase/sulfur reductase-like enzyme